MPTSEETTIVTTDASEAVDPKTDAKPVPKFTQAEMDAVAGNTRKEAAAAARKALLKELGIDPEDAKAVDTIKGKLTAAQQAEDAKKSVEEKNLEKIALLEKERDEAKSLAEKAQLERQIDKRNDAIKEAFSDPKLHCKQPVKLLKLVTLDHPEKVEAVMKDGKLDEAAMKALIELGKKENPEYFTGGTPGSVSNSGGRPAPVDKTPVLKKHVQF
jgi:hypothetical protein